VGLHNVPAGMYAGPLGRSRSCLAMAAPVDDPPKVASVTPQVVTGSKGSETPIITHSDVGQRSCTPEETEQLAEERCEFDLRNEQGDV
jgi:hypothetical protein